MNIRQKIPVKALFAHVMKFNSEILIGLGVLARVVAYLRDRHYWMDELSLLGVIREASWSGLFGSLPYAQLAPVGFLALEHGVYQVAGGNRFAMRFLPLFGGLISLLLFRRVAEISLSKRGALLALGMLAFSNDLIYFSSELKPYSTDVAFALICLLAGQNVAFRKTSIKQLAWLALIPWFSFPSVFMLAGIGLALLIFELKARELRRAFALVGVGTIWIVNVVLVDWIAKRQLGNSPSMFAFWDFAFPDHSSSFSSVVWALRRFAFLFANPLDFSFPGIGTTPPALFALALFLFGCAAFGKRDNRSLALLLFPIVFAMIAGFLRRYPFHGRLVLFLIPSLHIVIANGAEAIAGRVSGKVARVVLVGFLVVIPAMSAAYESVEPNPRGFHPAGDRRPAKLTAETFLF